MQFVMSAVLLFYFVLLSNSESYQVRSSVFPGFLNNSSQT